MDALTSGRDQKIRLAQWLNTAEDGRSGRYEHIVGKGSVMLERSRKECKNGARMGRIGDRPYWIFSLSVVIRALHQVGAAIFLAGIVLDLHPQLPAGYVVMGFVTGVLLLASEWLRHRQIHREVSGVVTLVKLLLLGAAYHGLLPAPAAVLLAFIIASLGSHAPKEYRHRLLF